eukprot:CAMPEP_0172502568 /NCGR_PEP_ID=MMETSP1066-20121228/161046_1 /TAXON_ID=671091 /ORGANISM="Coscinodiscus wailesii, Strain CCMP2513" /LENGTH=35 /DNA_ID= /DNA_START= /DNA_END= /DNA_ORIENTATION=
MSAVVDTIYVDLAVGGGTCITSRKSSSDESSSNRY